MASWCGATGTGLRRVKEIGSRNAEVEGLQEGRRELEGEHLGKVRKHLLVQNVAFLLYVFYLLG